MIRVWTDTAAVAGNDDIVISGSVNHRVIGNTRRCETGSDYGSVRTAIRRSAIHLVTHSAGGRSPIERNLHISGRGSEVGWSWGRRDIWRGTSLWRVAAFARRVRSRNDVIIRRAVCETRIGEVRCSDAGYGPVRSPSSERTLQVVAICSCRCRPGQRYRAVARNRTETCRSRRWTGIAEQVAQVGLHGGITEQADTENFFYGPQQRTVRVVD